MFLFRSFNPLQVSYKLLKQQLKMLQEDMFQSLIGQLQTKVALTRPCFSYYVSIPYRLATNRETEMTVKEVNESFNPLQVSYKPWVYIEHFFVGGCFNPLQVSYKRHRCSFTCQTFQSFNPLQVSYKRIMVELIKHLLVRVSIPYRLATNLNRKTVDSDRVCSFNPLQVSYKQGGADYSDILEQMFQSLIGQLQTLEWECL